MSKKVKAAVAGLAFVAGCEIGIAIALMKMIRDYTIKDNAINESAEISDSAEDDDGNDVEDAAAEETAETEDDDPAADAAPQAI